MSRSLKRLWRDEPARVVARLLSLVPLVFGVLTSFGITFDNEQQTAISALLYGIAVLFGLGGELIRANVTPDVRVRARHRNDEAGDSTLHTLLVIAVVLAIVVLVVTVL